MSQAMERDRKWQRVARAGLLPAGWAYSAAMRARAACYSGVFSSWRPPAPCVSVGNISLGGSGKTPLAEWILHLAVERGLLPALLTRGYKAEPPHYPYLVTTKSSVREAGDEPLLLARSCRQCLVVVDPRRDRAGYWVHQGFKPDLYVLDDGMQHLRVKRDLDLVLLGPGDVGRNWNRVLPSGPWREGKKALERANALVLNAPPARLSEMREKLLSRIDPGERPVFSMHLEAVGLKGPDGRDRSLGDCVPYLLLSAVAHPDRVRATASQLLGSAPRTHLAFPDHHFFHRQDIDRIRRAADSYGCLAIVCTPKDRVKLDPVEDERICSLDLRLCPGVIANTQQAFRTWLESRLFPGTPDSSLSRTDEEYELHSGVVSIS